MGNAQQKRRSSSYHVDDHSDDEDDAELDIRHDLVCTMTIPQRLDRLIWGYMRLNHGKYLAKEIVTLSHKYIGFSLHTDYPLVMSNTELLAHKHVNRKFTWINGAEQSKVNSVKLALIGASTVGKSTLCSRFCCNQFESAHNPTIEDVMQNSIEIGSRLCHFNILDTAGNDDIAIYHDYSEASMDQWMMSRNCYIFVYDITNRASWQQVKVLIERSRNLIGNEENEQCALWQNVKFGVICGNKCDLERKREIGKREVQQFVDANLPNFKFYECSAKSGINVDEIFYECAIMQTRHYFMHNTEYFKKRGRGQSKSTNCCVIL